MNPNFDYANTALAGTTRELLNRLILCSAEIRIGIRDRKKRIPFLRYKSPLVNLKIQETFPRLPAGSAEPHGVSSHPPVEYRAGER